MKKHKFLAVLLMAVMLMSITACGKTGGGNKITPTPTGEAGQEPTKGAEKVTLENASITFEDGNIAFIKSYSSHVTAANIRLSVEEYNGSKALKVENLNGKTPFIGIDLSSLLGENITKLAKVEMVIGTSYADGSFHAASGEIYTWYGEELEETVNTEWSVYTESKNPKVVTAEIKDGKGLIAGNIMLLNLKTDNGVEESGENAILWIDDIRFLDAQGNVLPADTTAEFASLEAFDGSGTDYSNLCFLKDAVVWDTFQCSGGGWDQNGFEIPDEIREVLVPGSVIEISYKSEDGSMWLVMPDCGNWTRVAKDQAYINNSENICQITFEQIAEAVGNDDPSTWGGRIQCEGRTNWEVYSIRVGQRAPQYVLQDAVVWDDFQCSGGGWDQNGFEIPDEVREALVPGSVVEISYKSDDDTMWLVMPDCGNWTRVARNEVICVDGKCYTTFEQIAAAVGNDDPSTWGGRIQCEAKTDWEVYSIRVGKAATVPMLSQFVELEGFQCSGGGWDQNGFEMTDEFREALVPGSVVEISYKSDDDTMWLVMPDCGNWTRVARNEVICVDGKCYTTFEQIAAAVGNDDPSTWGGRIQCEAKTDWEVYSVRVGKALSFEKEGEGGTVEPTPETESGILEETVGTLAATGSMQLVTEGGWSSTYIEKEDLLCGVDPEKITCIKFSGDTEFIIGYTTASNGWLQDAFNGSVILGDIHFGSSYYVKGVLDLSEPTTCTLTWEIYTEE